MNELFPYKPRKYQEEIVKLIEDCLKNKENLILEAPAGTGKTVCVLTACVSFARENKLGVIYLTRTNSQQKQAIVELKKIAKKLDLKAVGLQGKVNMCLLIENIPSLRDKKLSIEELNKICSARKKRSMEALKGKEEWNRCIFFENFILNREKICLNGIFSAEEILEYGKINKICAYEINKLMAKEADVIIAPYIYIFDDFLREKIMAWYAYPIEETILIVDEAHNLPDFCRELLSFSLSLNTIKHAINEANEYGVRDKDILNLLHELQGVLEKLGREVNEETNDALLEEKRLENELERKGFDLALIKEIANKMTIYGDVVADIKESKNMLPRSYIRSVGNFFAKWLSLNENWVRIVEKEEDNIKIEAYCLDASLVSSILKSFYCSIHISGTLEPMEEYKKSIGIEAKIAKFPSPFPKENRRIFYIEGITTKYYIEDAMIEKIGEYIEKICNSSNKNTLVLFPSYQVMERFVKRLKLKRKVYVEERKDRQKNLMDKLNEFKRRGGIFLSVMGGRLAEGIDFPSEELEMVIIVGIPYPPPSAKQQALQKFYDRKYGNGWKYVVEAQAIRKISQAIGRLIRREEDKGIAIILDERAKRFKKYIEMEKTKNVVEDIMEFFAKNSLSNK